MYHPLPYIPRYLDPVPELRASDPPEPDEPVAGSVVVVAPRSHVQAVTRRLPIAALSLFAVIVLTLIVGFYVSLFIDGNVLSLTFSKVAFRGLVTVGGFASPFAAAYAVAFALDYRDRRKPSQPDDLL